MCGGTVVYSLGFTVGGSVKNVTQLLDSDVKNYKMVGPLEFL